MVCRKVGMMVHAMGAVMVFEMALLLVRTLG